MQTSNLLGDFLRVRRQLLQPENVGLQRDENRRVPGLRREEVAGLAGISADYYLRLEQGRHHQPSWQVLSALSVALRLNEDENNYLFRLGEHAPLRRPRTSGLRETDGLVELLNSWTHAPAYISDRNHDVLATNAAAAMMANDHFAPGVNLVKEVFTRPVHARSGTDWANTASDLVASLRYNANPDDPRLQEIIGELSVKSREFRKIWALHDVHPQTSGTSHLFVDPIGWVDLRSQTLEVPGTVGQFLTTFFADPGTAGDRAIGHLVAAAVQVTADPSRTSLRFSTLPALSSAS